MLRWRNIDPDRSVGEKSNWGKFIYYFFLLLLLTIPGSVLFKLTTSNGFALGILLYPLLITVFVFFNYFTLMNKKTWQKEAIHKNDQLEFWIVATVYTLIIGLQALWDYFYSGAVQSWLISTIFFIFLLVRSYTKYRINYEPKMVGTRNYDPFKNKITSRK